MRAPHNRHAGRVAAARSPNAFEVCRCTVDAAERSGGHVAANQQQACSQVLHQVELAFGTIEIAAPQRLGHALEIPERLERANLEMQIFAEFRDIARAARIGNQVGLEDFDGAETAEAMARSFSSSEPLTETVAIDVRLIVFLSSGDVVSNGPERDS